MFTGIIEELGCVERLIRQAGSARLIVSAKNILEDIKIGDSISVNGACLTIIEIKGGKISFDIMGETLKKTNLSRFHSGDKVNLERSLKANDRLSGHFVLGHIDAVGKIISKIKSGKDTKIEIIGPQNLKRYLVEKGSISVDGISLTIGQTKQNRFAVYLIPHTLQNTTLGIKRPGDLVNLEIDPLARYANP